MIKVFQEPQETQLKRLWLPLREHYDLHLQKKSDGVNAKKPKQIVIIKISLLGKKVSGANKKPLRLKKDPEKGK